MDFDDIDVVPGAGNSSVTMNYSYTDVNPLHGVSYYRLKQTDYDGASETFNVVAVEFYGNSEAVRIVQRADERINELVIYVNTDDRNRAIFYDALGRTFKHISLVRGKNVIRLANYSVQSGIYHVRVVNDFNKVVKTSKVLVRK